jgi:serine/threonine protein kinase
VRPGEVLVGKYRVERVLGAGGMGVVVAAHHLQLDQKVAIKLLHAEALSDGVAAARFAREARTAVKIQSEHVARVTDVGELPNGAPFMVMEYLEGSDLATMLQQTGALPVGQAVDFLLQASVAVAEAHALRIVHRDLKPANLFCIQRSDGQQMIKVLDFGISKLGDATGAKSAAMTKTSAVMGTPLYMSPEQMRSAKVVDARTDIWALGVILYELVTGNAPFQAESVMELALNIAQEPPPPLRSVRPDAPAGLEAVILACVEKDPDRRYANVGELATALVPFTPPHARPLVDRIARIVRSAGLPSGPRASLPDAGVASVPHETAAAPRTSLTGPGARSAPHETLGAVQRTTGGGGRKNAAVMAISGVIFGGVAILGVAGWLLVRTPPKPSPTAAAPPPPSALAAPFAPSQVELPQVALPPAPEPAPPEASASAVTTATVASPPPVVARPPVVPVGRAAYAAPAGGAPAAPKRVADCDPPYTINAAGHRVHKPECP